MAIEPKQGEHYIAVSTPFGADVLILRGFSGAEYLSGLFRFSLDLRSEDRQLDFSKIIGQGATITITRPDGSERFINGLISRFQQSGSDQRFTTYSAELVPWLWMLTLSTDCRIFQEMTAPDIIKAVFDGLGYADYKDSLTQTYTAREYCVQYRETAFDFCARLMEEEGIFYFFEHVDGVHTLVLADDADAHAVCPGIGDVGMSGTQGDTLYSDTIKSSTIEQRVTTGAAATEDYNFQTPDGELFVEVEGENSTMRAYDYPGKHIDQGGGEAIAKRRLEAMEQPGRILRGQSFAQAFSAGFKFTVAGHIRDDVNAEWVLESVHHSATLETYTNSFDAFPAATPFRPPEITPKPKIPGTQTAVVVGPAGEEIYTDSYGRIKVQFHWDQLGQKDENSSCWVRVSQGWAGKGWGNFFLPRIGMEVVVGFLEGDPDRPLVTGCVYNDTQTVPYDLPADQTKSTIKTDSSPDAEGFNEIRFEDKAGEEEIYLHAQIDMNSVIENNLTLEVVAGDESRDIKKGNRTTTLDEGDDGLFIKKGSRTTEIDEGDDTLEIKIGSRTQKVTGDETIETVGLRDITVTGNETHTDKGDFTHTVSGNFTLDVSGDITITAGGAITIKAGTTLNAEAGTALGTKAGTELTDEAGTNLTVKAGANLSAEGGANADFKAGAVLTVKGSASGTLDGGGSLTVKGGVVSIN